MRKARKTISILTAAVTAALTVAGCSDDIVCPGEIPPDNVPYVAATVLEWVEAGGAGTHVEVFCTADPVPLYLVAFVNDRQLPDAVSGSEPGWLTTLTDDLVAWHPGSPCSLKVTTNYGFATAFQTVPEACDAAAPESISVGDSLVITWSEVEGADYYAVSATLVSAADTIALSTTVQGSAAVFPAEAITISGTVSGNVVSVAGPYPGGGSGGNVSGMGWGYFTVAYYDTSSTFELAVADRR